MKTTENLSEDSALLTRSGVCGSSLMSLISHHVTGFWRSHASVFRYYYYSHVSVMTSLLLRHICKSMQIMHLILKHYHSNKRNTCLEESVISFLRHSINSRKPEVQSLTKNIRLPSLHITHN